MSLYHNRQGRHSNSVDADPRGLVPGGIGELMLGVRNDAGGTLVSNDQEFTAIQFDNSGRLRVVTQGGAGGTSSVDDASFTAGVDAGTPAMGFFSSDTVDANDVGVLAMDASRRLLVSIEVDNVGIGGGIQHAVDDVAGAADTGTLAIVVRDDAPSTLGVADGDYTQLRVTAKGSLWTHDEASEVDTGNSTTSTLTAASVFTGTGMDLLHTASITIILDSSHDSATDGMQFQFSSDNVNWDISHDFTYTAADGGRVFQFPAQAKWFRLVFTNGGTNQTHLRIQTILHHHIQITTIHRLIDPVNPDRSAQLMKSVIVAQLNGSGDFAPVGATAGGNLKVSVEEADTSATGLAKAEDIAFAGGDVGVMSLAVRDDVLTTLTPADGDYTPLKVDDFGRLHVSTKSVEDGNNTTAATLGIDAVYTGTATDILHYKTITIVIFADEDSAVDGVSLQWSGDGTNWDHVATYTYTASTDFSVGASIRAKFFRVVYTNGGTGQSVFRMFTYLHPTSAAHNIRPLEADLTAEESSEVVRSVLAARKPDTTYTNIDATAGGNLKVAVEEFDAGIFGDIAHDAADSGNPVKTGSKAVLFNGTAPPNAAAAEDDRVNDIADEYGRKYVETSHPNHWDVSVDYATAQTNATIKAAPGVGLKLYITSIMCSNGATAGNITLLDGSGGAVKWELYPAINGGAAPPMKDPIVLTANTLLAITSTTVTTHSLTITGFIAP